MSSTPPLSIMSFGGLAEPVESSLPPFASTIVQPHLELDSATGKAKDPTQMTLQHLTRTVLKAKKIAVVCGAGISCASGIPDFRSSEGLFESLKRQYPEARLNTGKDLFDASLFSSEQNASIFYTMIAELKAMSDNAQPTAFHEFLKALDDEGKLFRVYTQNIDQLEERAGLTYGLGDKSLPLPPRRAISKALGKTASTASTSASTSMSKNASQSYPSPAPTPPAQDVIFPSSSQPTYSEIPRVIPLHGHLGTMSCAHCSTTVPIEPYMPLLAEGTAPICPSCEMIDQARAVAGDRSRGVGRLRPDVVLYGEEHKDGERVGEITRRDLMGARPDLLLVVGTTLKVPGTKRLVRELSKVTKPMYYEYEDDEDEDECEMPVASGSSTTSESSSSCPNSSQGTSKSSRKPKPEPVHVIYLNYEFPKPSTEWKDVFDVWLRGDIQAFVQAVKDEKQAGIQREIDRIKEKQLREIRSQERAKAQVEAAKVRAESARVKAENAKERALKAEAKKQLLAVKQAEKAAGVKSKASKPTAASTTKVAKSKDKLEPTITITAKKTKTVGGAAKARVLISAATKLNTPQATPEPPSQLSDSMPPPSQSNSKPRQAPVKRTSKVDEKKTIPPSSNPSPMKTRTQRLNFAVTKVSLADIAGLPAKRGGRP